MQQRVAIGRQLVSGGSTVRQAATTAGVGLSTLYKHLADKSDVRLGHRRGRRPALSDLEERQLIDFADAMAGWGAQVTRKTLRDLVC